MEIRPAVEQDRSSWEALFNAYADFYQVTLPPGTHDKVWSWILDPAEPFWCDLALTDVAASDDNEAAVSGFCQYQLMHRSLSGEMVCYLSDLFVKPDLRGSGCGRALIDRVVEVARVKGVTNVRWLTQDNNYPARQLYDTYAKKSDFILYSLPV